jgi:hypothetical protein
VVVTRRMALTRLDFIIAFFAFLDSLRVSLTLPGVVTAFVSLASTLYLDLAEALAPLKPSFLAAAFVMRSSATAITGSSIVNVTTTPVRVSR